MGSGIAQKMATEGFSVTLVDLDDEKVARGLSIIEKTLDDGVAARDLRRRRRGRHPRADHRHVALRGSGRRRSRGRGGLRGPRRSRRRLPPPRRGLPPGRDPRDQHVVVRGHRARQLRRRRPERVVGLHYFYHPAKNRLVEVVSGQRDRPGSVPPRLAPAGSARQDPDRLERFLRLHRQPLLPAVADRSRAHARGGRRRHRDDRRGGKEGVRDRHGAIRADERHRRADRVSCRDDARAGVRPDVRIAGAPARAGGIRQAVGDRRHAGRGTVHDRRRSAGDRCVLRRGRARRRGRRHDRGHRHRRARGPALAPRPVRADEPLRHRARPRSRRRFCRALEPARPGLARTPGRAPASRSASRSCVRRSPTASPR